MTIVLVSTYDLGRQPFGLASPAAWLRAAGHDVRMLDLAVDAPDVAALRAADRIGFYVPMHAATRQVVRLLPWFRGINPAARLCAFGLYAAMNAELLQRLGVERVIGGEYEAALTAWAAEPPAAAATTDRSTVELGRLAFVAPDRDGLPDASRYAGLRLPDGSRRVVGSTDASRGCKHRCRHCPIVPVYDGRFRIVPADVVLEDVRRQVAAGARHISFGDPDFWNGIGHAMPLVRRLHDEHPDVTYDVTIKIEHLLRHREHLAGLRDTGCLFVTSAVESLDDHVLARLDKGHTRADVLTALELCREASLELQPTFVAFTPWLTRNGYTAFLADLRGLGLEERVASIQLAIRLLIPAGSRLLGLPEIAACAGAFDEQALVHPWAHPDPDVDVLARGAMAIVAAGARDGLGRAGVFGRLERLATPEAPHAPEPEALGFRLPPVPFLEEPWYC